MSRLSKVFESLKQTRKTALIPYITAGDPHPDATVELMHALVNSGADILEVGVPFSDPMADGPVIQAACERALKHNVSLRNVLEMVTDFRRDDAETPVVLMGYLNPIEIMGYGEFAEAAKQAGVDGALIVDIPPEEAAPLTKVMRENDLDAIFLAAPTTSVERLALINTVCSGFLYYVSLKGVTGSSKLDTDAIKKRLSVIKDNIALPIGVGFGIASAEDAAAVAAHADAVVVGSALVKFVAASPDDLNSIKSSMQELLSSMRQAIDQVR